MYVIALTVSLLLAGSQASAVGGYGHVDFANSGAPAAQADFLEGLALLHDFEYPAAAAAFRRAEAVDPGFAMAYWGEAMTFNHPIWMQQDLKAAQAALNKLAPTPAARRAKAKTEREKGYLDAVEILYGDGSKEERDFRYEDAMAKLHARYPGRRRRGRLLRAGDPRHRARRARHRDLHARGRCARRGVDESSRSSGPGPLPDS